MTLETPVDGPVEIHDATGTAGATRPRSTGRLAGYRPVPPQGDRNTFIHTEAHRRVQGQPCRHEVARFGLADGRARGLHVQTRLPLHPALYRSPSGRPDLVVEPRIAAGPVYPAPPHDDDPATRQPRLANAPTSSSGRSTVGRVRSAVCSAGSAAVDQVGVDERVEALKKRSIKKASKLWALDLAIRMIDLTTLEGKDTPGKVRALCAKAMHPQPGDPTIPHVAAICVYPAIVAEAREALGARASTSPASRPGSRRARRSST